MTPGESTQLTSVQHSGVLIGMLLVAGLATWFAGTRLASLRLWVVSGCVASSAALAGLVIAAQMGPPWPLSTTVAILGAANGVFAVAAIGCMMALAGRGPKGKEGVRMGVWGAAQAIAFALGGLFGTFLYDALTFLGFSGARAYASAFTIEAIVFLIAAVLATRIPRLAAAAAPANHRAISMERFVMNEQVDYDAVVVGGGPAGATAANDMALAGLRVALIERNTRIKPCGGAIPPRLMKTVRSAAVAAVRPRR